MNKDHTEDTKLIVRHSTSVPVILQYFSPVLFHQQQETWAFTFRFPFSFTQYGKLVVIEKENTYFLSLPNCDVHE